MCACGMHDARASFVVQGVGGSVLSNTDQHCGEQYWAGHMTPPRSPSNAARSIQGHSSRGVALPPARTGKQRRGLKKGWSPFFWCVGPPAPSPLHPSCPWAMPSGERGRDAKRVCGGICSAAPRSRETLCADMSAPERDCTKAAIIRCQRSVGGDRKGEAPLWRKGEGRLARRSRHRSEATTTAPDHPPGWWAALFVRVRGGTRGAAWLTRRRSRSREAAGTSAQGGPSPPPPMTPVPAGPASPRSQSCCCPLCYQCST